MAQEKFRLPRSSYDVLARIIQAYGHFLEEATIDEVSAIAGTQRTVVSANNGFLADAGLVAGGNRKALTDLGRALARALEYENEEEIERYWRQVASETEFFKGVLSAVRIRRGMDVPTLQSHIAYSAGLPRNKGVMTGAAAVIEILELAGLLDEAEGKLVAAAGAETTQETPAASYSTRESGTTEFRLRPITRDVDLSALPIQIQIQVQCDAEDLETLAPRLRSLLRELSEPPLPDDAS